jgi:hypothetical protein
VLATTFDTNVAAAGLTISGTSIVADGTDANIDISITPKNLAGIVIPSIVDPPSTTTNKLYNVAGVLYFDGVNLEDLGVSTFVALTDTPGSFTTANAIYTTNGTPNAVIETTVILTEAANTFNITKGTASLDIASGSALDVNANLTVSGVSAIDQDVTSGSAPTFTADNFSDGGSNAIITTTQETNFEAAYTHVSSTGADHSYINQNVTTVGTPSFSTATAGTFYGSFDTNVASAGLTVSGASIVADGTSADISISITPKGLGYLLVSNAGTYAGSFTTSLGTGFAVYGNASDTGAVTNYGGYFKAYGQRGVAGIAETSGAYTNYGGYFRSDGDTGKGVYGEASATGSHINHGGSFLSKGNSGIGVFGYADATGSYLNHGVYGTSAGAFGHGVTGWAANNGDVINYGGHFTTKGAQGRGVYGIADRTGAYINFGGFFQADGDSGRGVYGTASATGAVTNYGGYFVASGTTGRGVYATAPSTGHSGYFDNGAFKVDSLAAISLDADAASSFNVTGAALTLQTTTSGDINLTPAGNVGTTLAADGTDAAMDITITPKGNAGIVLPNAAGAPSVTTNKLYQTGGVLYFDGVNLEGGFADPMTTRGDLIFKNSSSVTTRLGAGTANQVLQSDGTDISWQSLTASDVTDFDTEVSNNTDVTNNTTHRTSDGTDHAYINQDVTTSGTPSFSTVTATTFYGNLDTNVAAAGLTVSGTSIVADGTDSNIDITITPKGNAGIVLPNAAGAPSVTTNKLYQTGGVLYFDGVNLEPGFDDPMTTRGDLIFRNSSNVTDRLGVGTVGQLLMSDGTDFDWEDLTTALGDVTTVSSSTYTVLVDDRVVLVSYSSTGTCTVTIPSALIAVAGFSVTIKDSGFNASVNNIAIETGTAETIDGESDAVIDGDGDSLTLISDGSNLFII